MLNLYFLLGQNLPWGGGELLLINILDRFSVFKTAYEIDYCYDFQPASKKADRLQDLERRREQIETDFEQNSKRVIVGMGWMAIELLGRVPKTRASQLIGCRHEIHPFKYGTWFSYDPAAALFDPNLYVDIMGTVSAAIRYAGRQIIINRNVKPYDWNV